MANKAAGTPGYDIASDIMSDGKSTPPTKAAPTGDNFGSITLKSCENGGCTVEHTPHDPKGDFHPGKTHAFTDRQGAHSHVAKLMGLGSSHKAGGLS